jgi:hypothetical protein
VMLIQLIASGKANLIAVGKLLRPEALSTASNMLLLLARHMI